jgi:hypothetical protein
MADIGLTKAFKMRDAIEKKAKKGLAEEGYAEDQIDKIIKAHKLEL